MYPDQVSDPAGDDGDYGDGRLAAQVRVDGEAEGGEVGQLLGCREQLLVLDSFVHATFIALSPTLLELSSC